MITKPEMPDSYEVFGTTTILTYPGRVSVHLPGGKVVQSLAQKHPNYEAKALAYGFPDGEAMNRAHDRAHARLAWWLGLPVSPTLLAVADGKTSGEVEDAEEAVIMALHKYENTLARYGMLP